MTDFYAVNKTVCLGRYPGIVVSEHASHGEAVQQMFRLNEAGGMDDREETPCEEYPDPRAYPLADNH
jgi:hypothetical protein